MSENKINDICKNPACKAPIQPDEPFCRKCWSKNLTEEGDLVAADKVITVSTSRELEIAVKDYFEKYPPGEANPVSGQLILVKGDCLKDVTTTFRARSEYAARKKTEVVGKGAAAAASLVATAALVVFARQAIKSPGSQATPKFNVPKAVQRPSVTDFLSLKNFSDAKGADLMRNIWDMKGELNIQQAKEFSDKLWENKEFIAIAGATGATGGVVTGALSMKDRREAYNALTLANTVDELYREGFRIKGNRDGYAVIERGLKPIDRVAKVVERFSS